MLFENLKAARQRRGISQEALARELHVVRQTVSKWEKGLSVPNSEQLVQIAAVLDTSVTALLGEAETQETVAPETPAEVQGKRMPTWAIVLLALGSPIWLALGIAAAAVLLVVVIVGWSLIAAFWAIGAAVAACVIGGLFTAVLSWTQGFVWSGVALLGAAVFCAGLAIVLFYACRYSTMFAARLMRKSTEAIVSLVSRKEAVR